MCEQSILKIDESEFKLGDEIFVVSTLSEEEFQGILIAISNKDVLIKTLDGFKLRFFLSSIESRRIILSKQTSLSL